MARRCGCASDSCSCMVVAGDGITVNGTGSENNPYMIHSNVSDIETGFDVQVNNVNVATDIHRLDFRGSGVTVTPGTDEAVVTVPGGGGTGGMDVPAGTIWMFGASNPPAGGWLTCNGATLLIATYPDLFGAIGTNYGGDGVANFKLPNLVDRFAVGAGPTKPINGTPGGTWSKQVQVANLPPHTHAINHDHAAVNTSSAGTHDHDLYLSSADGTSGTVRRGSGSYDVGGGPIAGAGAHIHSVNLGLFTGSTSSTVGATSSLLDITPPYVAIGYIIKT